MATSSSFFLDAKICFSIFICGRIVSLAAFFAAPFLRASFNFALSASSPA
eukprot:CAMPEP_0179318598 /NCGR_PEP_ID=MMETSP0797-20121207/56984_1 /TAXON_ID=47934 /ORGANISM="Dinophysis acuminata, Strain DAEP01" /LENGTH=49 /DNA_ID=CAMNT_0021029807 /DNA_START=19 /DNA_END=168 /DNA_ORIENTATION=-